MNFSPCFRDSGTSVPGIRIETLPAGKVSNLRVKQHIISDTASLTRSKSAKYNQNLYFSR